MRSVRTARRSGIVMPPYPPAWVVCHELDCGHRVHGIEGAEVDGRILATSARECTCP